MKTIITSALITLSLFANAQWVDRSQTDAIAKQEMKHSVNRWARVVTKSDSIDIFFHELNWTAVPGTQTISGSVVTKFMVGASTIHQLYFDMSDALIVDSIMYHNQIIASVRPLNNTVEIPLPSTISANTTDEVTIYYHGTPTASFVTGTHGSGVAEVWTISEPYGASDWWPCKDALNDKVDSLDLHITTAIGNKVGSLGLLQSIDTVGNMVTYNWQHRFPVTSYLVSLAITNYVEFTEYVHIGNDSFPVINYVYPEDLVYAESQIPRIVNMFDLYDSLFIPYPFKSEKYGHSQTRIGGGMEHQTMSTMGFFSDDLMAHELAHQWFGDYVTCATWEELWLNEGFPTFLTGLTREHLGSATDWDDWKRVKINNVISQSGGSVFVTDTIQFGRLFNSRLTYDKGSMLLHMLRWKLGDDTFYQGIRTYLEDQSTKYSYVRNTNLISHLEAASNQDLDEYFNDWFYGEGYPTYTITLAGTKPNYSVGISQTTSDPSVDFFEMPVEIRFRGTGLDTNLRFENTENNQWFNFTLDKDIAVITVDPNKWLVMGTPHIILGTENVEESKIAPVLYPQPATSFVKIANVKKESNITDCKLFDVAGNRVEAQVTKSSTEWMITIEDLPAGMYFVVHPDWNQPLKFVK